MRVVAKRGILYPPVGEKEEEKKGIGEKSLKGWNLNQGWEWRSVEKKCKREEREREGLSFGVGRNA